nr:MAG TPA: hypothetical protein [Bacteriophage sp.]
MANSPFCVNYLFIFFFFFFIPFRNLGMCHIFTTLHSAFRTASNAA